MRLSTLAVAALMLLIGSVSHAFTVDQDRYPVVVTRDLNIDPRFGRSTFDRGTWSDVLGTRPAIQPSVHNILRNAIGAVDDALTRVKANGAGEHNGNPYREDFELLAEKFSQKFQWLSRTYVDRERLRDWVIGMAGHPLIESADFKFPFARSRLEPQASVPVPPAVWLFGSALGLLGWLRRRAN